MASHATEREECIAALIREGATFEVARAILRNAQTVQTIAVRVCNVERSGAQEKADELRDERALERIRKLAATFGAKVLESGDPRGYCVKLLLPSGRYNTWGGAESGWGIPAKG